MSEQIAKLENELKRTQSRYSEARGRIETLTKENCALRDLCRTSKALEEAQAEHRAYLEGQIERLIGELLKLEAEADWLAERAICEKSPDQQEACITENGPCVKCLRLKARREAAKREVENAKAE